MLVEGLAVDVGLARDQAHGDLVDGLVHDQSVKGLDDGPAAPAHASVNASCGCRHALGGQALVAAEDVLCPAARIARGVLANPRTLLILGHIPHTPPVCGIGIALPSFTEETSLLFHICGFTHNWV